MGVGTRFEDYVLAMSPATWPCFTRRIVEAQNRVRHGVGVVIVVLNRRLYPHAANHAAIFKREVALVVAIHLEHSRIALPAGSREGFARVVFANGSGIAGAELIFAEMPAVAAAAMRLVKFQAGWSYGKGHDRKSKGALAWDQEPPKVAFL